MRLFLWPAFACAGLWLLCGCGRPSPDHGLAWEEHPDLSGDIPLSSQDALSWTPLSSFALKDRRGGRLHGYLVPPQSGYYLLWIESGSRARLFLSAGPAVMERELVASTIGSRGQSRFLKLEKGKRYYVEALAEPGENGMSVRWRLPDGEMESPIPASRLRLPEREAPRILAAPGPVRATEGQSVEMEAVVAQDPGVSYQWLREGQPVPGADTPRLEVRTSWSDHESWWQLVVANAAGAVTNQAARLHLEPDRTPPQLVSAQARGGPGSILLRFSEPLDSESASRAESYSLHPEGRIGSARLLEGGDRVMLVAEGLRPGIPYRIGMAGILDRANRPNAVSEGAFGVLEWEFDPLPAERMPGRSEPSGPSSRNTALTISEIHHRPPPGGFQFVEIYNSEAWTLPLGGYRLSGDIEYKFPDWTEIGSRSRLVVAARPGELQAAYQLEEEVLGPWSGDLPGSSGSVQLRHPNGGLLLETGYGDGEGWPLAADGFGHSMILARPSLGEGRAEAWSASVLPGGSPGWEEEPLLEDPYRGVRINEFLADSQEDVPDFVELYNYSGEEVLLDGCSLSDGREGPGYLFSDSDRIPPGGYLVLDQEALGFGLSAGGEWIALRHGEEGRILDLVRFEAQRPDLSEGLHPDGSPWRRRLAAPTPGAPNQGPAPPRVVINEIMYHPPGKEERGEYLELFNPGTEPLDLSGWELSGGVRYAFPEGSRIGAGGYLVVARDAAFMRERYPRLPPRSLLGDYSGSLSNRGELLILESPGGVREDEVSYQDGGLWGEWADGGGSSLELLHPGRDNSLATSWGDSDETGKAPWTEFEHTGPLTLGRGSRYELHVLMLGRGECLLDDIHLAAEGEENKVPNGDFETGTSDWIIQGNHVRSGWSLEGEGYMGGRSLHLRASSGGDNGANRLEIDLSRGALRSSQNVELRTRARWLRGSPLVLLRLQGNGLELSARLELPPDLGTPGERNSRWSPPEGPAILSVSHFPVLPEAGQDVEVVALAAGRPGSLTLRYRRNRAAEYTEAPMADRGAGFYTAVIPGMPSRELVGFHVQAGPSEAPLSRLPGSLGSGGDGLVRFGEPAGDSEFGTYRLWIGRENLQEWNSRPQLSNEPLDSTFVYGDFRAVYNAGGRYRGSPWLRHGYSGPASSQASALVVRFPKDRPFLGTDKLNLDGMEPSRDPTLQREMASYWIAEQLGLPYCHQRLVHMVVNGNAKGRLYADTQHPSSEYVECWFPEEEEGELYKIDDWFEFNDSLRHDFNIDATLERYPFQGPLHPPRYRWNWEKKPHRGLDDDHGSLMDLVEALNTWDEAAYPHAVESAIDAEQWLRTFAVRHLVGDWDGYGYNRGKNMWAWLPEGGRWKLILWDLDFALGANSHSPTRSMYDCDDPVISDLYQHPRFGRLYMRAWKDAVEGPLAQDSLEERLDRVHQALIRNRVSVGGPRSVVSWIDSRRRYLERGLAGNDPPFSADSEAEIRPDGTAILAGKAPLEVDSILVDGLRAPLKWTDSSGEWEIRFQLEPGERAYRIQGLDRRGEPMEDASLELVLEGPQEAAEEVRPVIQEILHDPFRPRDGFVEIHNPSPDVPADLSEVLLEGTGYRFPFGFELEPGGHAVIAADRDRFASLHGEDIPVLGTFGESLPPVRGRLRLLRETEVLDQTTWELRKPWPLEDLRQGASLQLVHPEADNRRIAHWKTQIPRPTDFPEFLEAISTNHTWLYATGPAPPGWEQEGFDDRDWSQGPGPFGHGTEAVTVLDEEADQVRFRTRFRWDGPSPQLLYGHLLHQGEVSLWINGALVLERPDRGRAEETFLIYNDLLNDEDELRLRNGENLLAGQVGPASSPGLLFALSLYILGQSPELRTPGRANSTYASPLAIPELWLNEAGLDSSGGAPVPWVEIHNAGSGPVALDPFFLSAGYREDSRWRFPSGAVLAPGGFGVVRFGPGPGDWQAGISPSLHHSGIGLGLTTASGEDVWADYLNYDSLPVSHSLGALPDASNERSARLAPTPGAPNQGGPVPVPVLINEWMADNSSALADPATGHFSDWIELYNAGEQAADLSGYRLEDDSGATAVLPLGTLLEGRSWMLLWADGLAAVPREPGAGLHLPFRLGRQGEELALRDPEGALVDSISFGEQDRDRSQGRWPDGAAEVRPLDRPTPGRSNAAEGALPVLQPAPETAIREEEPLAFALRPLLPGGDPASLRLQLVGAPEGIAIEEGILRWIPGEADGPGHHSVEVAAHPEGRPDDRATARYSFWVEEVNRAPRIRPVAASSGPTGSPLSLQLEASDPDLPPQPLFFSLSPEAPTYLQIDPRGGLLSGAFPPPGAVLRVVVTVSDGGSPPLSHTLALDLQGTGAVLPQMWSSRESGEMNLYWESLEGVAYQVESTTDLVNQPWELLEVKTGSGEWTYLEVSADEPARYFRVRILAEEEDGD